MILCISWQRKNSLKDEAFPMSDTTGYLRPYLLDPAWAMAMEKED